MIRASLVAISLGGCAALPEPLPDRSPMADNLAAMQRAVEPPRISPRRDAVFAAYAKGQPTATARRTEDNARVANPGGGS